jgi:UDP-N-acetylglucosamine 2-epimerase (non-hydrolysing)
MKIATILGTRPEITKLSPLIPLLDTEFEHILIHTGQHYDYEMDKVFFEELNLRNPDYMLNVGSNTQAKQTAEMMIGIEKVLLKEKPDIFIVFADTNTPLAGGLVATKLNIPLIHLEAGCRSFNREMPEEINRIVCDHCADYLLAPDNNAKENLLKEGLSENKIKVVGSTAIEASLRNIMISEQKSKILEYLNIEKEKYVVVTIHRAENTNNLTILKDLIESINIISEKIIVVFPLHPRTKKLLEKNDLTLHDTIKVIEPQSYLNMLKLLNNCLFVMSDSGGIQEEAAAFNTPCLILRNETEWTYLTDIGKNLLLGTNKDKIIEKTKSLLDNREIINHMNHINLDLNIEVSKKIVEEIKNEFIK